MAQSGVKERKMEQNGDISQDNIMAGPSEVGRGLGGVTLNFACYIGYFLGVLNFEFYYFFVGWGKSAAMFWLLAICRYSFGVTFKTHIFFFFFFFFGGGGVGGRVVVG